MSRATARMRNFATHLMVHATSDGNSVAPTANAAFHFCEKLRPQLAALMGTGGFRGLLARALVLATPEALWLNAVRLKADGALDGLDDIEAQVAPQEIAEGATVLLAQLLGLLVAFIGEALTLRIVREVWPHLPFDDFDSVGGL